jgi:hypothetical protein
MKTHNYTNVLFEGHLLVGYWFAESDKYDITWTTPFCIMTLRLIGLVMDVYDGQKPKVNVDDFSQSKMNHVQILVSIHFNMFNGESKGIL